MVKFGPCLEDDLLDRDPLDFAFAEYDPVGVTPFAALSHAGEAMHEPGRYWRNNLQGSLNLVEVTVEGSRKHMVFSSTCGSQDRVVLYKQSQQLPVNAFSGSKRAVEDILRDFGASHGHQAVVFRYFNVGSANFEAEFGEWHQPKNHLIPFMIEAAADPRDAQTIQGTNFSIPDGTCTRDCVHMMNLVAEHFNGLAWLPEGKGSRVFKPGMGMGFLGE